MASKGGGKGPGKGPPAPGKAPPGKAPPLMKPPSGLGPPISKAAAPAHSGPKLRPVFWTTVNDIPEDSIWIGLEEPAVFDVSLLEKQFEAAASRPLKEKRVGDNKEGERKRLRVLDDKTSQHLSIALARIPDPGTLAQMVDKFDGFPWNLSSETIQMMAAAINENREPIEQLRTVLPEDAMTRLDVPERFLWEMDRVPDVAKKVRVGQLIVASTELPEWRNKLAKVGIACQMLRKSKHLSRCISTALAIGNHLNRGTARAGAKGLVLPDSLLKLEEVRATSQSSSGGADDSQAGGQQGPSLLDFVAMALVDAEVNNGEPDGQVGNSIEVLLQHIRCASGVALEEITTAVPLKIAEAQSVAQGLGDLERTPGQQQAAKKVHQICEEANLALKLSDGAKKEFDRLQKWCCSKTKQQSENFFGLWNTFIQQLSSAIAKAYAEKRQQQKVNAGGSVPSTPRPVLGEISTNSSQRSGSCGKPSFKGQVGVEESPRTKQLLR